MPGFIQTISGPDELNFESALDFVKQLQSEPEAKRFVFDFNGLGRIEPFAMLYCPAPGLCTSESENLLTVNLLPELHRSQIIVDEVRAVHDGEHPIHCVNLGHVETVVVDEVLVSRIFLNLLSNAIKYSPEGGEIRLELDQSAEWIILRVSDQGMGISEDDLPNIFNLFYRTDEVQHINGTGLGCSRNLIHHRW